MSEKARVAVFRAHNSHWYVQFHKKNWGEKPKKEAVSSCGMTEDIPVPGDYFGDGRVRHAVFRPSEGRWYIMHADHGEWAASAGNVSFTCGMAGDIPVPGDYFGEGRTRAAVFRPSNGTWYIKGPDFKNWDESQGNVHMSCGMSGDVPVPGDYFNEGKLRLAIFRHGHWAIKGGDMNSWDSSEGNVSFDCGMPGDIPVAANYFGDGTRIAVFRPSDGHWYIKGPGFQSWHESEGNVTIPCGQNGDIPVPADYRGDGFAQVAVFRPENGTWYIKGPGTGSWHDCDGHGNVVITCGVHGDIPVPACFKKPKKAKKQTNAPSNWTWQRY